MTIDELLIKGLAAAGGVGGGAIVLVVLYRLVLAPMNAGSALREQKLAENNAEIARHQATIAEANASVAAEHTKAAQTWKETAQIQLRMVRLMLAKAGGHKRDTEEDGG